MVSVHTFVLHIFFFKQKTAYDMRISDWSSDVCSSDLHPPSCSRRCHCGRDGLRSRWPNDWGRSWSGRKGASTLRPRRRPARTEDRKSVVSGKRVSVRVDLGGRRIIKKKRKQMANIGEKLRTRD